MTAKGSTKTQYRLILVTEESDYGNGRQVAARLEICYLGEDGKLLNPLWTGYGPDMARQALDGLVVRAQCDPDDEAGGAWYGWRLEFFRPYCVDLSRAESMATTLRSLTRKLAKLTERFGEAGSFEVYAARVADILGRFPTVQFGRKVDAAHDLDGSGYQWGNAANLRCWLKQAAEGKRTA